MRPEPLKDLRTLRVPPSESATVGLATSLLSVLYTHEDVNGSQRFKVWAMITKNWDQSPLYCQEVPATLGVPSNKPSPIDESRSRIGYG